MIRVSNKSADFVCVCVVEFGTCREIPTPSDMGPGHHASQKTTNADKTPGL